VIRARTAAAADRVRAALRADAREGVAEGVGLLLLAHVVRAILGLVAGALVARALDPSRYGAYAVAGAAVAVGITVADFGLSTSAARQIAADLAKAPGRAYRSAAAFARLRLLGGLLVLMAALVLAGPVAALLGLPDGDGPTLVRLAAATVLAAAANGVVSTIHHGLRRYRSLVVGQISVSLATVGGLAALFAADRLTLTTAMWMGIAGNLVSLGIGFALLPAPWRAALRGRAPWRGEESRALRSFTAWLGISAVFTIAWTQLDLVLVSRLLDAREVGLYGLALALAFKADVLNQALHTTLLPAVSRLSGREAYAAHVRRSLARSVVLAVPLLLALPLVRPFISAVYGPEYAAAAPIFYGLAAILLFDLLTHPVLLLAFPMNLPRWIAASNALTTATLLVAGVALIPVFEVYGAVVAKLLAKVAGALVTGAAIVLHFGAARQGAPVSAPAPDTAIAP
jgi:O-antigen/teichoic acid export membrane protein